MHSSINSSMTPRSADSIRRDDDFDARTQRIRQKILDGIEETLDELAQPGALRDPMESEDIFSAVRRAVRAQCAALLCPQALCRRAKRCRRAPCVVFPRAVVQRKRATGSKTMIRPT